MSKTKIIATIGPASLKEQSLVDMIKAGMNVARINASHGSHQQHREIIENIRSASKKTGKTVGILYDLQGPKLRIGDIGDNYLQVNQGEKIVLHATSDYRTENGIHYIPLQHKPLVEEVQPGETLLLNDGLVELEIKEVINNRQEIHCLSHTNGELRSNCSINAPETALRTDCLTPKDKQDIAFISQEDIDFMALSFVRSPEDIFTLHNECKAHSFNPAIIAKIERPEAVNQIEEITKVVDGLMVARGDLGIEIPAARVPIAQNLIVKTARQYSKPVIIATQVLSSMVENPRPTRAEISDAARAVFEQADGIMLSNETAIGNYPVAAVQTLSDVSQEIESQVQTDFADEPLCAEPLITAICNNAVNLAHRTHAKLIIIITKSGFTAHQISKLRPITPMIVISSSTKTQNELSLLWGIQSILIDTDIMSVHAVTRVRELLEKHNLMPPKGTIVICNAGLKTHEHLISSFTVG